MLSRFRRVPWMARWHRSTDASMLADEIAFCRHQPHRRFITDDVGNGLVIKAVRELWHVPFCCLKTRAYSFCSKDNMNVALSSLRRRSVVVRPNIVGHQTKQHFLNKVRASQTSITLN